MYSRFYFKESKQMKHPYSEIVKSVDTEDGDYKWHISVSKDGYMEDDSKEPIIDNFSIMFCVSSKLLKNLINSLQHEINKTESRDIRQA